MDKSKNMKCDLQHFVTSYGTHQVIQYECQRLESYVCTNIQCNLKLCNKCYKKFPTQNVTPIIPPTYNNDRNQEHTATNSNKINHDKKINADSESDDDNDNESSYNTVTSDQINDVIEKKSFILNKIHCLI